MSSLGSNKLAIGIVRQVDKATAELSKVSERLSSGQRINRASDDAAGLAIAQKLNSDVRVYTQAVRNVNDGISLLSIADGAIQQLKTIVTRITELSEQSANGTYSNTQRQKLDDEAQALRNEYNRIRGSTQFNGVSLLDNNSREVTIQAGYGSLETLSVLIGQEGSTYVASIVGDGTFDPRVSYSAGGGGLFQNTIVVGDFNNDGHQDFIAVNATNLNGYLFRGNGDGTFQAYTTFTSGYNIRDAAAGDFNNDGFDDFIRYDDNAINLSMGNGDGTFDPTTTFAAPSGSGKIELEDLNGDGNLDIVYSSQSWNVVNVLLGNGNGTFQTRVTYAATDAQDVELADFNGDGIIDIATSSFSANRVNILLGNGNGTFQAQTSFTSSGQGVGIVSGDFNGDGETDLAVTTNSTTGFRAFLGNGNGTFQAGQHTSGASFGIYNKIRSADINGDGYDDLIASSSSGDSTQVYISNGNGTFQAAVSYADGDGSSGMVLGDFNEDGVTDFATISSNDGRLNVFLGNMGTASSSSTQTTYGINGMESSDIDLTTRTNALSTLTAMTTYMNELNTVTSTIGAGMSRLSTRSNVINVRALSLERAKSAIMDSDIASNTAAALSLKIKRELATSLLAQANQQPALALKLLQS